MYTIPQIEKALEAIRQKAAKEYIEKDEDNIPEDAYGGNIDDAYLGGFEDGAIDFARSLVEILEAYPEMDKQ